MVNYKSCKFIQNGINFSNGHLKFCQNIYSGPNLNVDSNISLSQIQSIREQAIQRFKDGDRPECCEKCFELEEKDWDLYDTKLKHISIAHWIACCCACVYCSQKEYTKGKVTRFSQKSTYYDVYPLLKELYKTDGISQDLRVEFFGGDISMLKEFDKIMELLNKNNPTFQVYTNGINYKKQIAVALENNSESAVEVSLDCGTRETYKKIKGVDKFQNVISTLKKYVQAAQKGDSKVILKYIILPGYNTNKEEVDAFFAVCKQLNVEIIFVSIDYSLTLSDNVNGIPSSIYETYDYFLKRGKELGLYCHVLKFVESFLKQGNLKL